MRAEINLRATGKKLEMEFREAAGLPIPGEDEQPGEDEESKPGRVSVDENRNAIAQPRIAFRD